MHVVVICALSVAMYVIVGESGESVSCMRVYENDEYNVDYDC